MRIALVLLAAVALCLAACGGGFTDPGPPSPLRLTAVDPQEGSSSGGTLVTLRGSGFLGIQDDIAAIRFGLSAASEITVVNDNAIECRSPEGRVGNVNVTIINREDGLVLLTGGYRYVAPLLWIADGGDPNLATLFQVDLDTGQIATIGPIGYAISGLALAPDGTLFGAEDGNLNRLMMVDPASGAATPTGLLQDGTTGLKYDVRDITFVGDRLIGRTSLGEMVEINQTFGFITVLHDTTPLVAGPGIAAFGPADVYIAPFEEDYALYEWDPVGLTTTTGPIVTTEMQGTVDALAFDDGLLYALDADLTSTEQAVLYRVDPVTGETTWIADLSVRARAVTGDSSAAP